MIRVILVSYVTVFAAEIVGDKLLYTSGVLATRYATVPVMCGMVAAFMVKMGVAVIVGRAIASLPPLLVATITSLSFLSIAYAVWRKDDVPSEHRRERSRLGGALVAFAAVLFSEWADIGQVTAATLAARFGLPFAVWIGAVAAMASKGALAISFGAAIRGWIQRRIQPKQLRYGSAMLLLVLGLLTAIEVLTREY
jgi:putative Ca2+/H+ antiporter (TMEM165/GDT1 family)